MNNYKEIIGDIKIYYINLNRAIDRRNKLEEVFNNNNLNYKRVSAIDGNDLDINEINNKYEYNNMNIYEIACLFSHIKAMKEIIEDKHEYAIIMEDDCNFDYFKYKTIKIKDLKEYKQNWEIIQLAITSGRVLSRKIAREKGNLILRTNKLNPVGAIAYLINTTAIHKILHHFSNNKFIKVSDEYIFELVITYFTKPYFSYYTQKVFKSFIRHGGSYELQNLSKNFWSNYYTNLFNNNNDNDDDDNDNNDNDNNDNDNNDNNDNK
jgi:GR25 family glycosyltransferase involved in LPS biosynthesis